jgi:hypothetical protein
LNPEQVAPRRFDHLPIRVQEQGLVGARQLGLGAGQHVHQPATGLELA